MTCSCRSAHLVNAVDPTPTRYRAYVAVAVRTQDAPYLLELVAADWASQALAVRLALLTAAAKLFFARPPECQRLLGSLLALAAADTDQDVHDRGLLYYRWVAPAAVTSSCTCDSAQMLCFAADATLLCHIYPYSTAESCQIPECQLC